MSDEEVFNRAVESVTEQGNQTMRIGIKTDKRHHAMSGTELIKAESRG